LKSMAQARVKRTRAVELALEGRSYDEIARSVGYTNRGSAHRAVFKALAEREVTAVDELRQLELDRLERLHATYWHWPKATEGDVAAAHMVLKVIDRQIRLLGLVDGQRDDYSSRILVQPGLGT
jgi:hypothetical protein